MPKVPAQSLLRLRVLLVVFQIHLLIFHAAPQPLDKNVVQAAAATVHADVHTVRFQSASESLAGELRALVRVENPRLAAAAVPQGVAQRRHTKIALQTRRQPPTQHVPAGPVEGQLTNVTGAQSDRKSTRLNSSHLGISYA